MANLTIVIDDSILRRAHQIARQQGTSVDVLIHNFLTDYVGNRAVQERAAHRLLTRATQSDANRGTVAWSRDDLHTRS